MNKRKRRSDPDPLNDAEWLALLNSEDPKDRIAAAAVLYDAISVKIYKRFIVKTGSEQQAWSLVQQSFERFCHRLKLGRLDTTENVEAYIWTITRHCYTNWVRQNSKENIAALDDTILIDTKGIETNLLESWFYMKMRNFAHQIHNERAQIAILLYSLDFSTSQIACLLPWSETQIRRDIKAYLKLFYNELKRSPEYALQPNPLEKMLAFNNGKGDLSVTFINAEPKNFSTETEQFLCKKLSLPYIAQLTQKYAAVLVILSAFSSQPQVRLSFLPRHQISLSVLGGAPIDYVVDGIPSFRSAKSRSGRGRGKQKLFLDAVQQIDARLVDILTDERTGTTISEWLYNMPGHSIIKHNRLRVSLWENKMSWQPTLSYFSYRFAI